MRWIEWQRRNYAEYDVRLWVVETHDGTFVGDCGLTMQDVEAARAVRDCAAAHGIEHLVALIRPENTPSQGVARGLGMELERTAYVHGGDALVYGMVLQQSM